ncbi:MAG: helix-turn-helix domain-containing protein [Mediterranea sp.]|jgi:transcriptional regulator with XRE-family HTH domain|nr:helix-turn-helix domain-containing protein [Mediterranea sp.]
MEAESKHEKNVHQGRNIKRVRESRGMKQFTLAQLIGLSQQAVSQIEQKSVIEEVLLDKMAIVLEVPVDVLREMEDVSDVSFYVENNTFEARDNTQTVHAKDYNNYCSLDEIQKLYEEKETLYERQLKDKQNQIDFLKKLLEERK